MALPSAYQVPRVLKSRALVCSVAPDPIAHLGQVVAVLPNVLAVLDQFVAQELLEMPTDGLQAWQSVYHVACQMKTVKIVQNRQVKRCGGRASSL
jgi:hypothetical protein